LRSIPSLFVPRTNCVDTPPHIDYSTPKAVDNHDESIGVPNFQPPEEGPVDSQGESTDAPSLTGFTWEPLPVIDSLLPLDFVSKRNLETDRKMNLARYIRTSQRRFLAESFYIDAVQSYNDTTGAVLGPESETYLTEILTYLGTSTGRDLPNSVFNCARLWAALAPTTTSLTGLFLSSLKGLLRKAPGFHENQLEASINRSLKYVKGHWIAIPDGALWINHQSNPLGALNLINYYFQLFSRAMKGIRYENPVRDHVGTEFSTEFRNSEVTLAPLFRQHLIWILVDHCLRLRHLEDWSALLPAIHWTYQALACLGPRPSGRFCSEQLLLMKSILISIPRPLGRYISLEKVEEILYLDNKLLEIVTFPPRGVGVPGSLGWVEEEEAGLEDDASAGEEEGSSDEDEEIVSGDNEHNLEEMESSMESKSSNNYGETYTESVDSESRMMGISFDYSSLFD
jgi:hypothetical protein